MLYYHLCVCVINLMLCFKSVLSFKYVNRANLNSFLRDSVPSSTKTSWKHMATESDLREWRAPPRQNKFITGLRLKNSLHPSENVEFIPEEGRKVKWYTCGPTVYDVAHMGHARTYIACDTLRSIMQNYLNYDVLFVENVTDVDDKIIQRALAEGSSFSEVASRWEREFWADMLSLGVSLPDCITRVSDYVPEIVAFVARILANGYAYESEGSVYFDIGAFRAGGRHVYAKLEPSSFNDCGRILEAEGSLADASASKRSPSDFALWKRSKAGEPSWSSPWGPGRPGWHIECSAMSSCIFEKGVFDIHSGGIDLRFPHHDNEIAQSEAHFDSNRWVNYFIHFGHLHIKGLKMSKSLKNFVSIKEMLTKYNKRQIRLLFLNSRYDSTLNFSQDAEGMDETVKIDEELYNFFSRLNSRLSRPDLESKWTSDHLELNKMFEKLKSDVHEAILDNFDTPEVLSLMRKFITHVNGLMSDSSKSLNYTQALSIKEYLYRILGVFKLVEPGCEYGVDRELASSDNERKILEELVTLREKTRTFAQASLKGNFNVDESKSLLKHCDHIRDVSLPAMGIILEDDGSSVIKYKSVREQELERTRRDEKKKQREQLEKERLEKLSIPPEEFIHKSFPNKFGKLDENHLPLEYADGTPISKSERKSMEKLMEKHKRNYLKRLDG